jgi:hypothetical protein
VMPAEKPKPSPPKASSKKAGPSTGRGGAKK